MTQGLPILTFGQLNSIEMGVMAARSIANGDDYERLLKRVTKHNQQLYQMRKAFNTADNDTYDSLLASIGFDVVKNFARIYRLKEKLENRKKQ